MGGQEFGKLTAPAAPAAEQMERATAILRPFKRALPTLGVSKTTVPAVSGIGVIHESIC